VVCHELAHLAARERHGDRIHPHGPEWKALMRAAGYAPRVRMPAPPNAPTPQLRRPRRRRRYLYLHHCRRCRLSRTAKRSVPRWRCAACLTAGLDGILDIFRHAL
jgi:predicted SprT family Zn-dependent metalloprotease